MQTLAFKSSHPAVTDQTSKTVRIAKSLSDAPLLTVLFKGFVGYDKTLDSIIVSHEGTNTSSM